MSVTIHGIGRAISSKRISNSDLEERLEMSAEDILAKTGIMQRFHCDQNENVYTLMAEAAEQAMHSANVKPSDVNGIFVSTNPTGEMLFPSPSSIIASLLEIPSFYRSGTIESCAGGVIALGAAADRLKIQSHKEKFETYLVIAGDQTSSILRPDSTDNILFSDAAAALVVTNRPIDGLYRINHSDNITLPAESKSFVATRNENLLTHNGRAVYRFTTQQVMPTVIDLLGGSCFPKETYFIPHQANLRILHSFSQYIDAHRMYMDGVQQIGNTSPASPFMGLEDAHSRDLIQQPHVVLAGFGEGLSVAVAHLTKQDTKGIRRLDPDGLKDKYFTKYAELRESYGL